jgi:hypothetical protein
MPCGIKTSQRLDEDSLKFKHRRPPQQRVRFCSHRFVQYSISDVLSRTGYGRSNVRLRFPVNTAY